MIYLSILALARAPLAFFARSAIGGRHEGLEMKVLLLLQRVTHGVPSISPRLATPDARMEHCNLSSRPASARLRVFSQKSGS